MGNGKGELSCQPLYVGRSALEGPPATGCRYLLLLVLLPLPLPR